MACLFLICFCELHYTLSEIVISKPPQGYCILFWRVMTQPPKQRFFLLPLFDSVGEIK